MAGVKEMALSVATTLRTGIAPNPLPVDLWGYARTTLLASSSSSSMSALTLQSRCGKSARTP